MCVRVRVGVCSSGCVYSGSTFGSPLLIINLASCSSINLNLASRLCAATNATLCQPTNHLIDFLPSGLMKTRITIWNLTRLQPRSAGRDPT